MHGNRPTTYQPAVCLSRFGNGGDIPDGLSKRRPEITVAFLHGEGAIAAERLKRIVFVAGDLNQPVEQHGLESHTCQIPDHSHRIPV